MRTRKEKVHGPYRHGNKWRVIVTRPDGQQTVESFEARAEAQRVAAAARSQIEGRTLMLAVETFASSQRERGLRTDSVKRTEGHLRNLLQLETEGGRLLVWLTARRATECYESAQVGKAVDTHRNALAAGNAFGNWCKRRGWLPSNPFEDVVGVGRRKRGRPQLHLDEARKLLDACLSENSREGIAVAVALLLGARASEIAHRQVRDLDDAGRLLWIPSSKTSAGRRHLEVPEVLRTPLLALVKNREGSSWLFGTSELERPTRHWVLYHCKRLCGVAKVPVVTAHGLRGTQATLATAAGATAHMVSAALGHASTAITMSA